MRCSCINNPKRRAAAAFFATSTSPLVSRSRRLTIETCPPFAISKASRCLSSPHRVRALLGFVGWTKRNGGFSTTRKSSRSATIAKSCPRFAPVTSVADKAPLISLRNVTREYKTGARAVHALDGVSLEIARNEFVAVSGPSGCGKSTLIHLLAGLERPSAGEILVDGLALHSADDTILTQYRRRQIGLVFQFFNLLPTMNVLENVSFPLLLQGAPLQESEERARELIDLVGLRDRADHFIHQLSGGEQQRTAIARALVHRPSLLIADEPTGNLDSHSAAAVMQLMEKIGADGSTTLIVVTHSDEVARAASRRVEMRDGKIVRDST
ncbi:MAG: putative transport system ATP-binding protein [Verrucomicrobiota bacterium]